jgi:hypothetical protein
VKVIFEKATWKDAQAACKAQHRNAKLMALTEKHHHAYVKFILSTTDKTKIAAACPLSTFYTSGQRLTDCTSDFAWKQGATPLTYNPSMVTWAAGEPSCSSTSEICMAVWGERDYNMNDVGCDSQFCAVCQIPI